MATDSICLSASDISLTDIDTQARPDYEQLRRARSETRVIDRLAAHYRIESELASQLKSSQRAERMSLYGQLYDRLFDALPDHPQRTGRKTIRADVLAAQVGLLRPFLTVESTYVEIGCGDALLTKQICSHARTAIGVDVTGRLIGDDRPAGFEFALSDGIHMPLPDGSADIVYSNQLMEHLHPEDAVAQLQEIFRILKKGGRYICVTPSRLTGPHDISVYFGYEPNGFHLREYDYRTLASVFREVGFKDLSALVMAKGKRALVPAKLAELAETAVEALPKSIRGKLASSGPAIVLAGVTLVGRK